MKRVGLLVFALLCLPSSAHAILLFSDDFQDGNIDGWTVSGGGTASATTASAVANPSPSGNPYVRLFGTIDDPFISMTRTISTTPYADISLSYFRRTRSFDLGDEFFISWAPTGGSFTKLESITAPDSTWRSKTWNLPSSANNGSIDIQFAMSSDPTTQGSSYGDHGLFDDVRVDAQSVVPEPGSMVLFGLGMVGAGVAKRRRRKSKATLPA